MSLRDTPKFFDWETPPDQLARVRQVAPIYLDPATAWDNPTKARTFYALNTDPRTCTMGGWLGPCGLAGTWERPPGALLFMNPRYGKFLGGPVDPDFPVSYDGVVIGRGRGWARKWASDLGHKIALVPCAPDAAWWREMNEGSDWRVDTARRLAFVDPRTGVKKAGSKNGSTWFYQGYREAAFFDAFGPEGTLAPSPRMLSSLLEAT